MRNPLINYFFELTNALRPMQCPYELLDKYFETAEQLFNLPTGQGERILLHTQLANEHVRFWSERLIVAREDDIITKLTKLYTGPLQ